MDAWCRLKCSGHPNKVDVSKEIFYTSSSHKAAFWRCLKPTILIFDRILPCVEFGYLKNDTTRFFLKQGFTNIYFFHIFINIL
jgi:hypothetical protein